MLRAAAAVFLLLVFACASLPAPPNSADADSDFARGLAQLDAATIGDTSAAAKARAHFEAALRARPDDPLTRVHLGLAIVTQARDAPMSRKLALAQQGFREMDAAIAAAPDRADVRIVRAINASQLPLALDRMDLAREDFRMLIAAADSAGANAGSTRAPLPPALRRKIYHHAGAFALRERRAEAIALLERAAAIEADSPSDQQVQSMLALARRELTPPSRAQTQEPR